MRERKRLSMIAETEGMTVIRIINNCMMALSIVLLIQGVYVDMSYMTLMADLIICADVVIMHFILVFLRRLVPFAAGGLGLIGLNYLVLMQGFKAGNYSYVPVLVVLIGALLVATYAHLNEVCVIQPTYWMLVYLGGYLLLATFMKSNMPLQFGELYTICIIVFSFIYSVLHRQDRRLRLSSDRTYVPSERIRSANFILMSFGSGIVFFIGIVFLVIGHGEKIINAIWNAILGFLRYLFAGLDYEAQEEVAVTGSQGGSGIDFGELAPQEENLFLDKLWEILSYVMSIAVILLCIYIIVSLIISFYKRFQQTAAVKERDKVEYLKPKENISSIHKEDSSHISFTDRSPKAKIRRKYKKFIKKSPGFNDIEDVMTPEELENTAYKDVYENKQKIHELYERARYSNVPVSGKDVAEFERLFF